ncbi:serine protease inhibitor [Nocardiopsis potens]|uniref:serine protease inhibitor n=1 Tax=Nocardiopsis potens TaxID=1246458 RepID=UPI00034C5CAE|nr:serine protease inhibitor [Nocardiopsis potens]
MNRVTIATAVFAAATSIGFAFPALASAEQHGAGSPGSAAQHCIGKQSWPELVGVPTDIAIRTIEEQNPFVTALEVPEDTAVTTDFRCDRVRIFHSPSDDSETSPLLVTRIPSIG